MTSWGQVRGKDGESTRTYRLTDRQFCLGRSAHQRCPEGTAYDYHSDYHSCEEEELEHGVMRS